METPLLATLLRRLHLTVRERIHADLHDAGFADLTPAHIYVFQLPGPDGVRPTELAERTNTTKQAMNHLLAGLEDRGYVERVPADGDGRARVVRLTARGRDVMRAMRESCLALEAEWAEEVGQATVDGLRRDLAEFDAHARRPAAATVRSSNAPPS